MIAVTFAVPQESGALRAALRHACAVRLKSGVECVVGNLGCEEVLVFHTGIGCPAVAKSLPAMLAEMRPAWLISSGFAGALDPALRVGDLITDPALSAPGHAARLSAEVRRLPLATVDLPAATPAEKRALRERTGAAAVDMETREIAAACTAAAIPLLILRAISDEADTSLLLDYATTWDSETQRPKVPAILRSLANRPSAWLPFASFLRDLDHTAHRLAEAIAAAIE